MKFRKQLLIDLVYDDVDEDTDAELIENELDDHGRWSLHYRLVFKYEGKFYRVYYSRGATENQDEEPFEYEPVELDCEEVFPQARTITVYETI